MNSTLNPAATNSLSETLHGLKNDAAALPQLAVDAAGTRARRGWESLSATVRESGHQLGERARHASDSTVNYIRDEPVKSVLIAAAAGAAVATLIGLLTRSRH